MSESEKLCEESIDCCPHCSSKHKDRDVKEYKDLMNRLKRIEGQIRGIENMIEEDRYCIDIINQTAAVNSALNGFSKELLARHISSCVKADVEAGSDEKLDELIKTLQKLMG